MGIMGIGDALALIGAAFAVGMCGIGASLGMAIVQRAAAGLVSEQPQKYTRTLIFQLIPTTASLYGFVVCFLILQKLGMGATHAYGVWEGAMILGACLPIAIVGMMSSIAQAKTCASVLMMYGKKQELYGRAITMAIFIEFFALLSLIVSILAVMAIPTLG
jgi:V/A-type H+-transporting ATPase subunit K